MKFMTRLKKGHKLTRLGLTLAYAGLLVLFACPLATSTLAWFSIGNYTRIRNIEFGFDPGLNIEAELKSLSDGEWVKPDEDSTFRFSDSFSFSPVSNMFSSDWYNTDLDPEKDAPKYMLGYSAYGGSTTRSLYAEANDQYVSLTFRFTSDRDVYLFLDPDKTLVEADREANEKENAIYGYDKDALNRIEDACRISFFSNMGYTVYEPNTEKGSSTYYGGRLNANPPMGYWDYDASTNKEILYGEYDEEALGLLKYETVTEQEPVGNPLSTLEAVSKLGVEAITEESLSSLKEEGHIACETSYTLQELGPNASTKRPILYIPAEQTRYLTVCIYIEGWDLDCDTFIENATLASTLTFTGLYAKQGTSGFPSPVLGEDAKAN